MYTKKERLFGLIVNKMQITKVSNLKEIYPKKIAKNWELYLLVALPVLYIFIFKYIPMYGIQIAFKEFNSTKGIVDSTWVGMKYFIEFINSYNFWNIFLNTLGISLYKLLVGTPLPIFLALSLNYCYKSFYKKIVQMVTYAPHFISTVVICGMILQFLSPRYGMVNNLIKLFGGESINFMAIPELFKSVYVLSDVWQQAGWGSIIFLAALSSINFEQHEAAIVDGASILQRIRYVDIPGIMPIIVIMFILNIGRIMEVGFEKVLLLQNPLNLSVSEVIQTYIYRVGISAALPNFSYSTAVGLFTAIINFALLFTFNRIAKGLGETSLW